MYTQLLVAWRSTAQFSLGKFQLVLCIRWQSFQPWNKFKSNKIKAVFFLDTLTLHFSDFSELVDISSVYKVESREPFKYLLLIPKGPGLFLLSIVFALSPIQERGRAGSHTEHRLQPSKGLQRKPPCVTWWGSALWWRVLFLCLDWVFYKLVAVFSLVPQTFISENCYVPGGFSWKGVLKWSFPGVLCFKPEQVLGVHKYS